MSEPRRGQHLNDLTGTATLVRFALRRDRVRIAVWIGSIVALMLFSAQATKDLYPTPESLAQAAQLGKSNAAVIFNGPAQALDTLGGQFAFQAGTFGLITIGLMSVFMVGRLTRAEEENGRTEMVAATAVGRHAQLAAALIVVVAMDVVVAAITAAGLPAFGMPVTGSVAFGVALAAMGLVSAAAAALAAQVTENTRVVYGSCGALMGLSFVLRAIGDISGGAVSWLSPIGWSQKLRPWAGERWWALAVPAAATAAVGVAAWMLASRRDVGAGLVAPRPGKPAASPRLGSPLGLALRLQRGSIIGWAAGVIAMGVTYGSIADLIDEFAEDTPDVTEALSTFGGANLTEAFFTTTAITLALLTAGFAVQSMLRAHTEETALRAESLLATPVSRTTWTTSHLTMAVAGSAVMVVLGNVAAAVTYGIIIGDFGWIPKLAGAALATLPAIWLLVGVAAALFGLVPRAAMAAWAPFALAATIGMLGQLLKLPSWVNNLSPFHHVPALPAQDFRVLPVLVLTAAAVGLIAAGLVGFRRRDTPA